MATNPLFPTDDSQPPPGPGAVPDANPNSADDGAAAEIIRQKVARAYAKEPDASQEMSEAEQASHLSKHQKFMRELSTSGKDLATIQTEWHDYYHGLTSTEKHQVWQEFYDSQALVTGRGQTNAEASPGDAHQTLAQHKHEAARSTKPRKLRDARSSAEVQAAIRDKVSAGGTLQAKHHLQSLLFGLGVGAVVVIIFLFGFFNEVVIAPFIQPSRTEAATPLIVNSSNVSPTATPEVIIPKINVEIPVDYSQTTTNEASIENALQDGVVHYPTTSLPGQNGNAAFFGHSSNNIFNKGKYKFAFVLLHTLQNSDTFYLTYSSKVYAYKVISTTIVEPSNVGVLGPVPGQTATATLITCDPPGTSLHRLIVVGQQISPDPSTNSQANATPTASSSNLPGNGPTLWTRFTSTAVGKIVIAGVLVGLVIVTLRWAVRSRL
jgi:LPXTG-site transpeptidase (sortase) family protein